MGVRFSTEDSANLIKALNNNVANANQIISRLSNGCDHLISSLNSGQLQGAAYTAGKGLFEELIIPTIRKLQAAIEDIKVEITSYEYAHSILAEYDLLDMAALKAQLEEEKAYLRTIEGQIARNLRAFHDASSISAGIVGLDYDAHRELARVQEYDALIRGKAQLELNIAQVEAKISKLEWFELEVSQYFSDSLEVLMFAIKGAVELSSIIVDESGHFSLPNGKQLEALRAIVGVKIENQNSTLETIKMLQEVFGFSKETACDIQELMILMKMSQMDISDKDLALKLMILFGSVSYGDTKGLISDNLKWDQATGEDVLSKPEWLKKLRMLGFSEVKANGLFDAIESQHSGSGKGLPRFRNKPDFSHMMITGAAELSNNPQILANIRTGGRTVPTSGWLGDSSYIAAKPSLGNDDYKADLDAVNIAHRLKRGNVAFDETLRQYYNEIKNGKTNRAKEFQTHYKLEDIKNDDNSRKDTLNETAKRFVNSLEQNSNDYIDEEPS